MAELTLIKDGVRYGLWDYDKDEVNKFEPIVVEHREDIFGVGCVYFPKQKLKTLADNRSIPDGFVVDFENQRWYIVEFKLLCDDAVRRIAGQIVNYKNAIDRSETKRGIYKSIKAIKDAGFLDDLINDMKPEIVVIIDSLDGRWGKQFKEQVHGTDRNIKLVEFKTFRGEGDEAVHVHLFEPLYLQKTIEKPLGIPPEREEPQILKSDKEVKVTYNKKEGKLGFSIHDREFFAGYLISFKIMLDGNEVEARVTSAKPRAQIGDPMAGRYIYLLKGKIAFNRWLDAHPELKPGDKLIIEAIEPKKQYKLRISR